MNQHHYPPEPGAIRSLAFPHMFVVGSYRDMLVADLNQTSRMARSHEEFLSDDLAEWQAATGHHRATRRQYLRLAIERVRRYRGAADDALAALANYSSQQKAA